MSCLKRDLAVSITTKLQSYPEALFPKRHEGRLGILSSALHPVQSRERSL
jgi:hypothetical protein